MLLPSSCQYIAVTRCRVPAVCRLARCPRLARCSSQRYSAHHAQSVRVLVAHERRVVIRVYLIVESRAMARYRRERHMRTHKMLRPTTLWRCERKTTASDEI